MLLPDHRRLARVDHRVLAEHVLDFLQRNGIDARLDSDDCGGINPALAFVHGTWLVVPHADFERAAELYRSYEQATLESVDELNEEDAMGDELADVAIGHEADSVDSVEPAESTESTDSEKSHR